MCGKLLCSKLASNTAAERTAAGPSLDFGMWPIQSPPAKIKSGLGAIFRMNRIASRQKEGVGSQSVCPNFPARELHVLALPSELLHMSQGLGSLGWNSLTCQSVRCQKWPTISSAAAVDMLAAAAADSRPT